MFLGEAEKLFSMVNDTFTQQSPGGDSNTLERSVPQVNEQDVCKIKPTMKSPHVKDTPKTNTGVAKMGYVYDITIPASRRMAILKRIKQTSEPSRQRGKRFKESYDIEFINEDIHAKEQIVYTYKMSEPICVICDEVIDKNRERCKFSIAHLCHPEMREHCGTHVYCLDCFIVLKSTCREGKDQVCYGTLLSTRGGCHQKKALSPKDNTSGVQISDS